MEHAGNISASHQFALAWQLHDVRTPTATPSMSAAYSCGTLVHAGHGDDTTIGSEAPNLQAWLERGH